MDRVESGRRASQLYLSKVRARGWVKGHFHISPVLWEALKAEADRREITASALMREILTEYIDSLPDRKGRGWRREEKQ